MHAVYQTPRRHITEDGSCNTYRAEKRGTVGPNYLSFNNTDEQGNGHS